MFPVWNLRMDFNKIGIGGAYTKICWADLIMIGQLQHDKEWSYFWGYCCAPE